MANKTKRNRRSIKFSFSFTSNKYSIKALRTKHRKAIQRKDKHRIFNHRRRQNQYPSSNPI
jgi:hypothetical protein